MAYLDKDGLDLLIRKIKVELKANADEINKIIQDAPEELDTLKELADYLKDSSVEGGIVKQLAGKVDKITGKGLSTNDLTAALKQAYDDAATKAHSHTNKSVLDGITSDKVSGWDNKYTKPSTGIPKTDLASAVQTSLEKADSALQSHQDISGKVDKETGKGLSTNDYTTGEKNKLAGIEEGANKTNITDTYSSTSSDGMSGKAVASALTNLSEINNNITKTNANDCIPLQYNKTVVYTLNSKATNVPSEGFPEWILTTNKTVARLTQTIKGLKYNRSTYREDTVTYERSAEWSGEAWLWGNWKKITTETDLNNYKPLVALRGSNDSGSITYHKIENVIQAGKNKIFTLECRGGELHIISIGHGDGNNLQKPIVTTIAAGFYKVLAFAWKDNDLYIELGLYSHEFILTQLGGDYYSAITIKSVSKSEFDQGTVITPIVMASKNDIPTITAITDSEIETLWENADIAQHGEDE